MSCNFPSTFEIAVGITYAAFETLIEICPSTYIRPDPGGSQMPFILVGLLLLLHLPTCVIRAVRWENAQYLALGLAALGISLTVQAYISTKLKAEEVLVWMPLTLVLDVGAMLQMVVLIIEKHDETLLKPGQRPSNPRRGLRVLWDAVKNGVSRLKARMSRDQNGNEVAQDTPQMAEVEQEPLVRAESTVLRHGPMHPSAASSQQAILRQEIPRRNPRLANRNDHLHPGALRYAIVAFISFILLLMLLVLQLIGLHAAVVGRRQKDIRVNWCSPSFRDFAVAVTTGNCEKYNVIESSSNGIGCISLPGDQQRDWLTGTIVALAVALVCQVFDTVLMLLTNSDTKWRKVKVQRPWLTMFGGVIMLVVLVVFGVHNSNNLPKGVTEAVWIFRKEPSREMGRVCRGLLNPPGLRGSMIGYMDGLFESWGRVYHGVGRRP